MGIADALQDTTIDAMIVGHTHRVSNLMLGNILITEGINAGTSYSVLQLMVERGDVTWAGGATRIAKDLGVAPRADVQAIVDDANAETAVLRNQVIGTQVDDIRRDLDPAARVGDGQPRHRRDARRSTRASTRPTRTRAACARTSCSPRRRAGEQPGEITWGEVFAVLPFGNRTAILTLTGAQLQTALLNGFSTFCDPANPAGPGASRSCPASRCSSTVTGRRPLWTAS